MHQRGEISKRTRHQRNTRLRCEALATRCDGFRIAVDGDESAAGAKGR
jgi:hypothetical protein